MNETELEPLIWALIDDRAGNTSQTIGLAEALKLPYEKKFINYNKLAFIPNIIVNKSKITIDNASKKGVKEPYPDIVISSGRRLAPLARYLKKQKPSTKLFHMMWPEAGVNEFDLIILPQHDNRAASDNIFKTIGAINKVNNEALEKGRKELESKISHLSKPYISLLIGGNTKTGKFSLSDAKNLAENVNKLALKIDASVLITTSRRTDKKIVDFLRKEIQGPKYVYSYGQAGSNPYMGLLAIGDIIIVTGDSISMCSEACFTGKPVYIYSNDGFCAKKHLTFHKQLIEAGYAKSLNNINIDNIYYNYKALNEAERVAEYITKKFLNN